MPANGRIIFTTCCDTTASNLSAGRRSLSITKSITPSASIFRNGTSTPAATPVRELPEVIDDIHLHETGMLKWIDHPEFGRILVHASPLVVKDVPPVPYRASTPLGSDARGVLREFLSISDSKFEELRTKGAFAPIELDKAPNTNVGAKTR